MSPPRDLFDDNDEEDSVEDANIRVNKRFAKEYTSRKQREELRNVQQQDDDDDDSSTSESEDEDGDLLSPSVDISILKTIHALRNKDESIYDPSSRFFPEVESGESSSDEDAPKKEKKHTPKKFKDVIREQIVEQMEAQDISNGEMEDETHPSKEEKDKSHLEYDQEQRELRSAFLESTAEQDDEDDNTMLVLKRRDKQQHYKEADKLIQQELEALEKTTSDATLKDPRGEVEDGDQFLLDFIKNKKWIDKDEDESSSDEEQQHGHEQHNNESGEDSMDELDRADDFESKYNFRYEEAQAEAGKSGADFSVMGYARSNTMNTLRRKDETRKQKRQERKERKAAERKAKEEQLRRLKNAKREEMDQKLKQIKSVLGVVEGRGMAVDEATILKLMEGDYDPEKFEEVMNEAYGDDFYQQHDADWKTDHDVRESLLKDEDGNMIAGLDDEAGGLYDNEDGGEEYGDDAEGDETDQQEDWNEDYYGEGEEEAFAGDPNQEETETERKLREKMKDELYKLDYEDIIAGMPTRFKYRSVPKNDYGLSTEEILFAKDTTLKNFVSLKKMAPYREDEEYHVGSKKRRRFREMLKQDLEELGEKETEAVEGEQGDAEAPKKKKRRRQKKGKKKDSQVEGLVGVQTDEPAAEANEEPEANDTPHEDDANGKRKRKKKGKKADKQSEEAQRGSDSNAVVKSNTLAVPKDSAEVDASKSKKKRRKKKKKKKAVAVEGLSASRLASYNL